MTNPNRPRIHPILRSAGATGAALAVAVVGSSAASATPRTSPAPSLAATAVAIDTAPLGSVSPSDLPASPQRPHGPQAGRTVLTYAVLHDNRLRQL